MQHRTIAVIVFGLLLAGNVVLLATAGLPSHPKQQRTTARSLKDVHVTIGGVHVPVVAYGPDGDPGFDLLTIDIPESLRSVGETDPMAHVNGRTSNAVPIYLGGEKSSL